MIDRLTQIWQNLGDRDRRSIIILAVFFLGMGLYLGGVEPVYKQFESLARERASLENQMAKNRRAAASLPRREARLAEVRQEYEYLLNKLEVENTGAHTLVEVINEIKDFSTDIGVDIGQIRPLEVIDRGMYQQMPLEITLKSRYDAFNKFLYYLETSPQIFLVSDLHMTREKNGISARVMVSKLSLENEGQGKTASARQTLRIGLEFWPGYAPFYIAEEKGWLETEDLTVRLVHGSSRAKLVSLLATKDLDGISLSLGGLIATVEKGLDVKAVFPTVWARGAQAIVASKDSGIKTLADLKGALVHAQGRLGEYLVFRAVEKNGLSFDHVRLQSSSNRMISQGLTTGMVQAGVLWDPYLSLATLEEKGHIIFSSRDIPGEIVENLVVHSALLKDWRRDGLESLMAALTKATAWMAEHPDAARKIVASRLNMSRSGMEKGLERVYFPTVREKQMLIGCAEGGPSMGALLAHQERFLSALYKKKVVIPERSVADWSLAEHVLKCSPAPEKGGTP